MNEVDRRKINRQNARNSTGPKTVGGKLASRRNALKDGLTAQLLILPNEAPEVVKAQNDAWFEALLPASQDELDLVNHLAYTSRRMQRFSKTENALLTEQVLTSESRWDVEQQNRVLDLVANLIEKAGARRHRIEELRGGSAMAPGAVERGQIGVRRLRLLEQSGVDPGSHAASRL